MIITRLRLLKRMGDEGKIGNDVFKEVYINNEIVCCSNAFDFYFKLRKMHIAEDYKWEVDCNYAGYIMLPLHVYEDRSIDKNKCRYKFIEENEIECTKCGGITIERQVCDDIILYSYEELLQMNKGKFIIRSKRIGKKAYYHAVYRTEKEYKTCDKCIAKEKYKPDDLFNIMVLSHGVATGYSEYSGNNPKSAIRNIINIYKHPEWEICCAHKTQMIGPMGIFVMGTNTLVSNYDVHSYVDSLGERTLCLEENECILVANRDQYRIAKREHTEHFVRNTKIKAIWIKKAYYEHYEQKEDFEELFRFSKDKNIRIIFIK